MTSPAVSDIDPSYRHGFARNGSESQFPDLWRGLRAAWVPALGNTGSKLIDIVNRRDATYSTPPTWYVDSGHWCVEHSSNEAATFTPIPDVDGAWTFLYWADLTTQGTAQVNFMYDADGSTLLGVRGGAVTRSQWGDDAANTEFADWVDSADEFAGWQVYGWLRPSASAGGVNYKGKLPGKRIAEKQSATSGLGTFSWSLIDQIRALSTRPMKGAFVWKRALTDKQWDQLIQDPLCFLRLRREVWGKAPAAGGDPEGSLIGGKLVRGGLLLHGVLGR